MMILTFAFALTLAFLIVSYFRLRSSPEGLEFELKFSSVNGRRLAYRRFGQGKKILLLHGLGASSYSWRYIMMGLSPDHDVLAPDLLGFGFSDRTLDKPLDLEMVLNGVVGLLEDLKFTPEMVVGSSLGGRLTLRLAELRPDLCPKAICIAPATNGSRLKIPKILARWLKLVRWLCINPLGMLAILWYVIGNWRSVNRESMEQYMSPYSAGQDLTNFYQALLALSEPFKTQLDGTKVTIIWGKKDRLVSRSVMNDLKIQIPKAQFIELPRGSHHPHEQDPEAFLHLLKSC